MDLCPICTRSTTSCEFAKLDPGANALTHFAALLNQSMSALSRESHLATNGISSFSFFFLLFFSSFLGIAMSREYAASYNDLQLRALFMRISDLAIFHD
jgi:hypothetical protein